MRCRRLEAIILEHDATGANFGMMTRWIADDTYAIGRAKEYRATTCGDRTNLYW
jgi:hypothetical protein